MTVVLKGLKDLDRALGRADKRMRSDLRGKLKAVANVVAVGARAQAQSKGLRQSGDLIAGIKPFALMKGAGVRSTAVHRGFAYPNRLEYEGRQGGKYGPRATLWPAYEDARPVVLAETERIIDRFADDFGGGIT